MADQFGDGRFDRVRKLGEGGMGSVWLAWDRKLERKVAIKQVRTDLLTPQGRPLVTSARVLREARAASRLRHPNIVQILDLIEDPVEPLIIMEYVEGRSLSEWIERRPATLTEGRAAEIGMAVLDALITAHAEQVVHRDVKPANILIQRSTGTGDPLGRRVRLIDFGNAAIEGHQVTTKSVLVGTLGYMAPERFRGRTGAESDLWSLGVTLYQAVEHRLPFQREQEAEIMHALLDEDQEPDPMTRADRLAPVIRGLLVKDPGRRMDAHRARRMLGEVIETERARRRSGPPPPHRADGTGPTGTTQDHGTAQDGTAPQTAPLGSVRGFAAIVAHSPQEAVALLRRQGPRASAQMLDRLTAGSDEAVTVVTGVGDAFAAEMLAHALPETAAAVLGRIPADRAARLLAQIPPGAAAPVLAALPPDVPTTVRTVRALPRQIAARLLNDLTSRQVVTLLKPLEPAPVAGILGGMSPRRAAAVLDRFPEDLRQAATLLRGLPEERIGAILDQMDARRVARILLVHPDRAARFLHRMGLAEQRRVLDHLG